MPFLRNGKAKPDMMCDFRGPVQPKSTRALRIQVCQHFYGFQLIHSRAVHCTHTEMPRGAGTMIYSLPVGVLWHC